MPISILFLVIAIVFFAMGAWRRWWTYYPAFMCGGLFFWALSQLWPMLAK